MCIVVGHHQEMEIADHDIIVYKLLIRTDNGWVTPFQRMHVGIPEKDMSIIPQETDIDRRKNDLCVFHVRFDRIYGGLLHAYVDGECAFDHSNTYLDKYVWKMKIPKGAKYIMEEPLFIDIRDKLRCVAASELVFMDSEPMSLSEFQKETNKQPIC